MSDKKEKGMGDQVFLALLIMLLCLFGPYLYYAYLAYQWGMENKPQGYKYPEAKNFLITGMGILYFSF